MSVRSARVDATNSQLAVQEGSVTMMDLAIPYLGIHPVSVSTNGAMIEASSLPSYF